MGNQNQIANWLNYVDQRNHVEFIVRISLYLTKVLEVLDLLWMQLLSITLISIDIYVDLTVCFGIPFLSYY